MATPVKTGQHRANWHVSLGNDTSSPTEDTNWQAALSRNAATIRSHSGGQDIYISNNGPAISALNNGSSAQAPAGFIEKGLQTAANHVRKIRLVR